MNNNVVILKGRVAQEPNYEIIAGSDLSFINFKLGVNLHKGGKTAVFLKGNVAQAPRYTLVEDERPFLCFNLAVDRPPWMWEHHGKADFLRVVAYDERALFDYAYLQVGSELLVSGGLRWREFEAQGATQSVVEVVADADDGIVFLRNVNYEEGDARRKEILQEREERALPGVVGVERRGDGGGFFRVTARGRLAESAFDDLRGSVGAQVLVMGRLQARRWDGRTVVEVAANDVTFLRSARQTADD
jgi:single-stranded DNA-binding protein